MASKESILALFSDDVAARKSLVHAFVTDKTNTYEDRLEVWRKTPDHLQTKTGWLFHHPTIDDDDWCNYNNWSRHEEISLVDYDEYMDWSEEKIVEFYTGCMDEGIWGFTFDW